MSRSQPQNKRDVAPRDDTDRDDPAVELPSEFIRSVITLVVFIHLFILFSGAFARTRLSSDLLRGLYNAPGFSEYLGVLHMGQYSFHLTHYADLDQDYNCDVVVDWRDGIATDSDEFRSLRKLELFDERGTFPPTRRRRYQRLAQNVAANVGAESANESRLPLAIAKGLLAEQKITAGRHRFRSRRQEIRVPEFYQAEPPSPEDPYDESLYSNTYQADVTFFKGKVNINKVSESRETAPVDRPRGRNRSSLNRGNGSPGQLPTNTIPLPNAIRN